MSLPLLSKQSIYDNAASVVKDLDRALVRVQQYKAWLDTQVDATLISQYGAAQADLDVLRSALGDLDQLRTIYTGTVNLASAKDFRTFSKQVYAYGSV